MLVMVCAATGCGLVQAAGEGSSGTTEAVTQQVRDDILAKKINLILGEHGPLVKPGFVPLPAGSIRPNGWIHDWSEAALQGITGHLDEWDATFGEAWKGRGFKAMGSDPADGTGWPLEQCAYWLDGAVRMAYLMNDPALIRKVSARLDGIVDGVLNGGESLIYWKPKDFIAQDGFNSWAHSHMGRALVAYYEATGKPRVLEALVKVYSHFPLPRLPDYFHTVTGAVNADPMIETYLLSGNRQILDILLKLAGDAPFKQVTDDWNNGRIQTGHGVIYYENIRVPAMLYPWTGDRAHRAATQNCFDWLDERHQLPYGISSFCPLSIKNGR